MIAERTLAQAAHAWGAQAVPFSDQPKTELFRTASLDRATALLNQSAALRSVMLLSGENGVGKSALAGRWLRALEPKAYFPLCITQASLTGIGVLAFFLQKLGKAPKHQRSTNLKLKRHSPNWAGPFRCCCWMKRKTTTLARWKKYGCCWG